MIPGTTEFLQRFKEVTQSHVDIYSGDAKKMDKWQSEDFNSVPILETLDKTNNRILLYAAVKKSYDVIKAYQRTYTIYKQSREDYYRQAIVDRPKDTLIVDNTITNLNKVYDDLNNLNNLNSK